MALLLIGYARFEPHKKAIKLIEHTEAEAAEALASITLLKMVVGAGSSSHLPLVSGVFGGLTSIVEKALKYAAISNMMLVGQLILLKLTKSWFFTILTAIPLLLFIFNRAPRVTGRLLLLFLLLNPGLDITVNLISLLHHGLGRPGTHTVHNHAEATRIEASALHEDLLSSDTTQVSNAWEGHRARRSERHHRVKRHHHKRKHHGLRAKVSKLLGHTLHGVISALLFFLILPFGYYALVVNMAKKLWAQENTAGLQKGLMLALVAGAIGVTLSSKTLKLPESLHEVSEEVLNHGNSGSYHGLTPAVARLKESFKPVVSDGSTSAKPEVLMGIDVSHNNGRIDWRRVKKNPIHFAYAKATEGAEFVDPKFKENWRGMKSAGVLRGAYHFFWPYDDPEAQARNFIAQVGDTYDGDLPIMLDLEVEDTLSTNLEYINNVKKWLSIIENQYTNMNPVFYVDYYFANEHLLDSAFAKYPLWIADYTTSPSPLTPDVWKTRGWTIWQYTASGKVPGIKLPVDRNKGLSPFINKN